MVKIARAVQDEWRQLSFHLAVELFYCKRRRRETQKWTPSSDIDRFKGNYFRGPGIIQVEVRSAFGGSVMHWKSLDARNS
jgi:hypothetical protein